MENVFMLFAALIGGFVLAAVSGLRAFLPMFLLGLASLLLFPDPTAGGMDVWIVALLGVAVVIEIAADKIPAVDHAVDVAGLALKPLFGGLIGYAFQTPAASGSLSISVPIGPIESVIIIAFFALSALVIHILKAKLRVVSSLTTAGIGNPFVSILEDFAAVTLCVLAIFVPIVAGVTFALLVLGVGLSAIAILQNRRRGRQTPAAA